MQDEMLRLAGIVEDSIVDGPGLRLVLFAQGCPHMCPNCHNPETHPPYAKEPVSIDKVIVLLMKNSLCTGLTLSGGEPFAQAKSFSKVALAARKKGLNIWAYTGYTYEELIHGNTTENGFIHLLELCDVLVDGRYIDSLRSLDLDFRGSANQRILDVPASLATGQAQRIAHYK